jgi:hypothetical protein
MPRRLTGRLMTAVLLAGAIAGMHMPRDCRVLTLAPPVVPEFFIVEDSDQNLWDEAHGKAKLAAAALERDYRRGVGRIPGRG